MRQSFVSLQAGIITKGDWKHTFLSTAVNITYRVCLQVKGYRYLEEDNSDESDSERSEEDEEKEEEDERVVEEMEAEDGEEGGHDRGAHGADSPGARRRGAEGQRRKHEAAHMKDGETDEREWG